MHGKSKILLHYSMILQGSPSNGTFEWINRYKCWNPYILPRLSKLKKNNFFFKHSIVDNIRMRVYAHCYPRSISCYMRRHECLGLLLRGDIEALVVDTFEGAINDCISLSLCLKNTLVQLDVLSTHSPTIDYHVARNLFCGIVYHMLLIHEAIHFWF